MSRHRPFFALLESMVCGRGSAATGPPGTVALARSIVIPFAPCMCRCMDSRTPCCARTGEPLAGIGLWSSYVLLRCEDLLWGWAISIATGGTSVVRHPLEPSPCATLRAGMQRGMVHREQVRCRSRRLVKGHREEDAPLGTQGSLSTSPACDAVWCTARPALPACASTATSAYHPAWNSRAAGKR